VQDSLQPTIGWSGKEKITLPDMIKKIILPLFALTCLAQWFVPAQMIYEQEQVLREGKTYHFKTAPIDPSDPFRGKYITLSFEEDHVEVVDPKEWKDAKNVYVSIIDSAGFARISRVSMYEPEGADYIKARINYVSDYEPYTLQIQYPFERFYLEESKASEAERLYWSNRLDSTQVIYAVVSVKDGNAALKDVMVNDRSIVEVVKEINDKKELENEDKLK
jgi:uncharacterized membrane-anchored protein